jgi:hypothetical protein
MKSIYFANLANKLHSSPWHSTDQCPLKDPTYIINKKIHKNVMQHNHLQGKISKNYHKGIGLPNASTHPTKATIPRIAHSADTAVPTHLPSFSHPTINPFDSLTTPLEDLYIQYDPILSVPELPLRDNSLVNTSTFNVPPPTANLCTTQSTVRNSTYHELIPSESSPFLDLLMDPMDYLHFRS